MIVLASFALSSSDFSAAWLTSSILATAACRSGVSMRSPGGAAMTTRRAAPFWPWNLALIRSVAFWKSVPGTLNSLTSEPWKATFRPIRATKMPEPGEDDPPRVPGTVAGDACEASGVGDPPLFFEPLSVVVVGHEAPQSSGCVRARKWG